MSSRAIPRTFRNVALAALALLVVLASVIFHGANLPALAQQQGAPLRKGQNVPVKPLPSAKGAAKAGETKQLSGADLPPEAVEADVSTRTVGVTSSFTGTEIVVFGAIDNSRQPAALSGMYDVVVVIEGVPSRITTLHKTQVGGIWLNTSVAHFDSVPSYYAIASTRPLEELASEATLIGYEIGFDYVRMTPSASDARLPPKELKLFREATVRLKRKEGLYVDIPHGVTFLGRSLFRATINLPANVPIGPFETRVYLFREERLISQYNVRLDLERRGIERVLHDFAFTWPLLYGIATVLMAVGAGLFATGLFQRAGQ